jgi:hypothetical protein
VVTAVSRPEPPKRRWSGAAVMLVALLGLAVLIAAIVALALWL